MLPVPVTELYLRMGVYPTGYGSSGGVLLVFRSPLAVLQPFLIVNPVTYLMSYCLGNATPILTGTHPVLLNAWQCIEVYVKIADAPNGIFTVKIDGVTDIAFTGDTRNVAADVQQITFLYYSIPYQTSGYLDDIAINDTAGAFNNSWIGRGGIYPKYITGIGTYTDLHASAGDPWDCIKEVPPNDADYVYDDTVNQKSVYAGSVLVPTTGTIACINVIMRALQDAAGTASIARLIRSNGVDSQGSDVGLSTTAKTIQEIIETDPGEVPGTAWTIAAVNVLQAGAVVR
jgi:hypothetical protein